MKSIYRKEGRTARLELDRYGTHRISVREAGEAVEHAEGFECRSLASQPDSSPPVPPGLPPDLLDSLERLGAGLERATVASGTSAHQIDEPGRKRSWRETYARFHASVVARNLGVRCEIDRASDRWEGAWLSEAGQIRAALERAAGWLPAPASVVLEPGVTAAVVAGLERWRPKGVALVQRPRPGEIDGRGRDLQTFELASLSDARLGWYRPSYRIRPRLMPYGVDLADLEAAHAGAADTEATLALALLAPIRIEGDAMILRCLVSDGDQNGGITDLRLRARGITSSRAIGDPIWFPFGAGAWGRRLIVTAS